MPVFSKLALFILAVLPFASAEYEQCGGSGWSDPSICTSGTVCIFVNEWYSQCLKSTSTSTPPPNSSAVSGLHTIAKSKGKVYFGTATDNSELSDAAYAKLLSNNTEFGQLTPGNSMKWDATEGTRDVFTFTRADEIVNFAKKNGQLLRGHTCVWHSQLPSWVSNGNFNATTLTKSWDVVNEPFLDDGNFRDSVFYNTLGTTYFGIALKAARAADPAAKLYINDYNIDGLGAKSTAMANLVKKIKTEESPIDGVGIQGHLISGAMPSYDSIKSNLEQFTALGVDVAFTELDIRLTLPVTADKLEQQRKDYETVIKACNAVLRCVGVTIWDYTDKYSWIPSVFDGQGAALPWDENFNKKPAYSGIVTGFA